ncbi:MAG TPA: 6-phosphofructokinase [Candidatus Magasanikbacteria bacterium]|nr:6-phosphofructokinase [Candidatus Magasanikbacteria bacterium]
MTNKKTVFILTGGGLSPAFNSLLCGAIKEAQEKNWKILGGLYGWASLLDNGQITDLTNFDTNIIKNLGGTFLRSSRTNPFKIPNGIEQITENIKKLGVDAIVVIGGDDTLGAASLLFQEKQIPTVGIPKTIDNDLSETYWTPGYPSAAWQLADYTRRIKIHAAYALSRLFIIEVPGFKSGWIAASSAFGGADIILPPEKVINCSSVIKAISQKYSANGNYATVVISQYARFDEPITGITDDQFDQYNTMRRSFIGLSFTEFLKKEIKIDIKNLHPGNFLEAIDPIEIDRELSLALGQKAINLVAENQSNIAVCLKRDDWTKTKIEISTASLNNMVGKGRYKFLNEEMFDFENFTVKQKFFDYLAPVFPNYPEQQIKDYCTLQNKLTKNTSL